MSCLNFSGWIHGACDYIILLSIIIVALPARHDKTHYLANAFCITCGEYLVQDIMIVSHFDC